MKRILEPELMDTAVQARAYAKADFSAPHQSYVELFDKVFPQRPAKATVLDLGCGPADVTIRFAIAHPGYTFHGVDGSAAMLRHGRLALGRYPGLRERIRLIKGYIPRARLPLASYDLILSSSFLHHLHEPQALWETVRGFAKKGTLVFVVDLFRPASRPAANVLVKKYASGEPDVLRRDFFNSLCASFVPAEVEAQLREAGLTKLRVKTVSDRHLMVWGTRG